MKSFPEMSPSAEHDASNDVPRRNWRIGFLPGVAAGHEAVTLQILKDQPMRAESARGAGHHDIAHMQPPGWHAFDAQVLAVPDKREHAPAARLKPDLMALGQQSAAQLLEQNGIAALLSRGTQELSPPQSGQEQNG